MAILYSNTNLLDEYGCKFITVDGQEIIVPTTACAERCKAIGLDAACRTYFPVECHCMDDNFPDC